MAKHEIRADLSGTDLATLRTEDDLWRAARRLLSAALEELGQALAEAAWAGVREPSAGLAVPLPDRPTALRDFVVEAGRRYKRRAPAADRQALEDVIVRRLRAAKAQAAAGTKAEGGSTVPGPRPPGRGRSRGPARRPRPRTPHPGDHVFGGTMRTLEYTLPDGTTGTATPDDVAKAVEALLMDGTMVMDSKELAARLDQLRAEEARYTAIVRSVVERAIERGGVTE
jgi:hypothetical protein